MNAMYAGMVFGQDSESLSKCIIVPKRARHLRWAIIPDILDFSDAGWSSLAARRAHNPKVVGSNPAPATKILAL